MDRPLQSLERPPCSAPRPMGQAALLRFRRAIPRWCYVAESGQLMTPNYHLVRVPDDCERCLDLFWDGITCRADYYTWNYGEVYRYRGPTLPTAETQWSKYRYMPPVQLEIQIVNLVGSGVAFSDVLKRVNRPRSEVCAILKEHDYPGWSYFIHGDP